MPKNIAPGVGLGFGWKAGESGIWNEFDDNWLAASVLAQPVVLAIVDSLPENPEAGDTYILSSDNRIAYRVPEYDNSSQYGGSIHPANWRYMAPSVGWRMRIVNEDLATRQFNGESWVQVPNGPKGEDGPPNTLEIGTVATGDPGSSAMATIEGDAPNQTLNLVIPRGDDGSDATIPYEAVDIVESDFINGWVPRFPSVPGTRKKYGRMVDIVLTANGSAATNGTMLVLPEAWRPTKAVYGSAYAFYAGSASNILVPLQLSNAGSLQIPLRAWNNLVANDKGQLEIHLSYII